MNKAKFHLGIYRLVSPYPFSIKLMNVLPSHTRLGHLRLSQLQRWKNISNFRVFLISSWDQQVCDNPDAILGRWKSDICEYHLADVHFKSKILDNKWLHFQFSGDIYIYPNLWDITRKINKDPSRYLRY